MLAWRYDRSKSELGHFLDLLGNNPGLKLSWILVQILTLPFANASRAKESSTTVACFPCLPLLRNSALFFSVYHFCDVIICMFSPTHPHKKHAVVDFTFCCPCFVFKKPGFHKQLMSSLYFMAIYYLTFLQNVDVLLLLVFWHVKKYIPSCPSCVFR